MAALYLDSSAAVKIYIAETGTRWMRSQADPASGNELFTVRLTAPELIAALARRARGGRLSRPIALRAIASVRSDWTWRFIILDVDERAVAQAMDLAERHGLRGYDAVHLAAALVVHRERQARALPSLTFVSADQEHLHAARAEDLLVDDPNQHP